MKAFAERLAANRRANKDISAFKTTKQSLNLRMNDCIISLSLTNLSAGASETISKVLEKLGNHEYR